MYKEYKWRNIKVKERQLLIYLKKLSKGFMKEMVADALYVVDLEYQTHTTSEEVKGGLGVEQNVVTLCNDCHYKYDNGFYREQIGIAIREYLKYYYGFNWNEKNLYYDKWKYSKEDKWGTLWNNLIIMQLFQL